MALRNVIFDRLWTTTTLFAVLDIGFGSRCCERSYKTRLGVVLRFDNSSKSGGAVRSRGDLLNQSNILSHRVWHRTYMTKSQAVLQGSHLGRMFAVCKYSCTVCLKWSVWIARVLARTLPCSTAAKKEGASEVTCLVTDVHVPGVTCLVAGHEQEATHLLHPDNLRSQSRMTMCPL